MKLYLSILTSLVFLLVNPSKAQKTVPAKDEQNIKRKSLLLINRLADKYNQLLESDSFERNILIDNMTLPRAKGAVSDFVSDQVIIEDDFNTDTTKKGVIDKKVDSYFKDIGFYYGMRDNGDFFNTDKKVVFSNVVTSHITYSKTEKMPYLQVFFEVKYEGTDSRTGVQFLQPVRRMADIQLVKQNGVWQVGIKSIRFYVENKDELKTPKLFSSSSEKTESITKVNAKPKRFFLKKDSGKNSASNKLAKKELGNSSISISEKIAIALNSDPPLESSSISENGSDSVKATFNQKLDIPKAYLAKKDSSGVQAKISSNNQKKQTTNGYLPEIVVTSTGLLSTVLAISLNKKWKKQFASLGNNYSQLKEAEEFKSKKLGLRNAYVSIALASAAADAFLIFKRVKTSQNNKLTVSPHASAMGITLNYNF